MSSYVDNGGVEDGGEGGKGYIKNMRSDGHVKNWGIRCICGTTGCWRAQVYRFHVSDCWGWKGRHRPEHKDLIIEIGWMTAAGLWHSSKMVWQEGAGGIRVSTRVRGGVSERHHEQGALLRGCLVLKYCIFTVEKIFKRKTGNKRHSGVLMKLLHSTERSLEKWRLGM